MTVPHGHWRSLNRPLKKGTITVAVQFAARATTKKGGACGSPLTVTVRPKAAVANGAG